jgi:hypothetical protein
MKAIMRFYQVNYYHTPKFRGGLLPSHGGERRGGVGGKRESSGDDPDIGSPSNFPLAANSRVFVSWFLISASVRREIKF